MQGRKYNTHGPTSFIKSTYEILSNPSLISIMQWSEDGKSFIISDLFNFTNKVLPKYFKHKNLSSFIRQLNMYGFHKIKEEQEILQFFHPLFQREKKELLKEIHRKSNENNGSITKEDISVLATRLQKFQNQQITMESMLENLEVQYCKVLEQNQILISELFKSKQREKEIELFLLNFTQQAKEDAFNFEKNSQIELEIEPKYPDSEDKEGNTSFYHEDIEENPYFEDHKSDRNPDTC